MTQGWGLSVCDQVPAHSLRGCPAVETAVSLTTWPLPTYSLALGPRVCPCLFAPLSLCLALGCSGSVAVPAWMPDKVLSGAGVQAAPTVRMRRTRRKRKRRAAAPLALALGLHLLVSVDTGQGLVPACPVLTLCPHTAAQARAGLPPSHLCLWILCQAPVTPGQRSCCPLLSTHPALRPRMPCSSGGMGGVGS